MYLVYVFVRFFFPVTINSRISMTYNNEHLLLAHFTGDL